MWQSPSASSTQSQSYPQQHQQQNKTLSNHNPQATQLDQLNQLTLTPELRHQLQNELHDSLQCTLLQTNFHSLLHDRAKSLIRKKGVANVTVEELVEELIETGRGLVGELVGEEGKKAIFDEVTKDVLESSKRSNSRDSRMDDNGMGKDGMMGVLRI